MQKVQVDTVTGGIKVLEYAAVHDVGRVVNSMGITGQLRGRYFHGSGLCPLRGNEAGQHGQEPDQQFSREIPHHLT